MSVTIQNMAGEVFTIPICNGFTVSNLLSSACEIANTDNILLYDDEYKVVQHRDHTQYLQNGGHFYFFILDEDEIEQDAFCDYYEQGYELENGFD